MDRRQHGVRGFSDDGGRLRHHVEWPATAPPGGGDAFVARYDTNAGTRSYSTVLGGTGDEFAAALAVDTSGNAYVTARSGSSNFPTTAGAADTSYNGGSGDVVIAKLDPTGSALVYATFLGGTSEKLPPT